jgi:hypothetical protein
MSSGSTQTGAPSPCTCAAQQASPPLCVQQLTPPQVSHAAGQQTLAMTTLDSEECTWPSVPVAQSGADGR